MSSTNPYQFETGQAGMGGNMMAAFAEESARAGFIRKTYLHLAAAVLGFVGIEALLLTAVPANTMEMIVTRMVTGYGWLIVLGAFMAVSWMARRWAESGASPGMQYMGLSLYVVGQAIVFLPLLYIAMRFDPQTPVIAGMLTSIVFFGLTAFVFVTRVDLSWMGKILFMAGLVAMGAIVCGIMFGFSLGIFFSAIMVAVASGYILYDTSNVLHHYRTDQYVAASLALFASVALLFWYILQLVMSFSSND
ncbi:Modulator of FtsH protease YccA [Rosistilla oblonga]|uniref:Modulator of FtsH protease YccA n=1 Tax=Rosistilla oblonga TaxID=2527990 RepID=A0A518INL7_9BACT|nr:Bax inhibitor-1 family protein [Rosistilla oblonga]QDV10739.1 Modulator of FtsH protease YccA [Rosistilla oblonga]QDV54681.1 Modulator of FtsH protease YccA [Rosistilla oblonga]